MVFCVFDDVDAIVAVSASGGNVVVGAMNLNYYAQTRFALLAIGELRAMHRRNNIDLDKLMEDVDSKWKELESDVSSWDPYGI